MDLVRLAGVREHLALRPSLQCKRNSDASAGLICVSGCYVLHSQLGVVSQQYIDSAGVCSAVELVDLAAA